MGISKSSLLKFAGWSSMDNTSWIRIKRQRLISSDTGRQREVLERDEACITHRKHVLLVALRMRMLLCITLWVLLALPLGPHCLRSSRGELWRWLRAIWDKVQQGERTHQSNTDKQIDLCMHTTYHNHWCLDWHAHSWAGSLHCWSWWEKHLWASVQKSWKSHLQIRPCEQTVETWSLLPGEPPAG